jgi:hypothetical protein
MRRITMENFKLNSLNFDETVKKTSTAVMNYLKSDTASDDRIKYDGILKDNIANLFNIAGVKCKPEDIIIDNRKNRKDTQLPAIIIPVYRTGKINDGVFYEISNATNKLPFRGILSFGQDVEDIYTDAEITASILYSISMHTTTFFTTRISKAILKICERWKISYDDMMTNQLYGILSYFYSMDAPILHPDLIGGASAVFELLSRDRRLYEAFVLYSNKVNQHAELKEYPTDDGFIKVNPKAIELNSDIIKAMEISDKKLASFIAGCINAGDGSLLRYIYDFHDKTGIGFEVDRILDPSPNRWNNTVLEPLVDAIRLPDSLSESVFAGTDYANFRYLANKIQISSKYIEDEDQRLSIVLDIFRLKKDLNKAIKKNTTSIENVNRSKNPNASDLAMFTEKVRKFQDIVTEMESLEKDVVTRDVTPKKIGVFVSYPAGY